MLYYYESGVAPQRIGGINIQFLISRSVYWCRIPSLAAEIISVQFVDGKQYRTEPLASISALIKRDFDSAFPGILTRAISSALLKTAAAYGAQEAVAEQNASARLAVSLFSAVYNASTNVADTRCWWNLPDMVAIAKVPIPKDRIVTINHAGTNKRIALDDGEVVVLRVQAPNMTNTLTVNQLRIK